jgi:hypothetical protein
MLINIKYFIAGILLICFISCKSNNGVKVIDNSSPQYTEQKYVEVEKLFTIDVTEISFLGKEINYGIDRVIDFDENNNMYILDLYESKIWKFNENGEFVESLGGKGQGPKEFLRPNALFINKEYIYVFMGFHEIKIVDLKGEFVSSLSVQIENPLKYYAIGDSFYLFCAKLDQTFTKLKFILKRFESDQFAVSKEIFNYDYLPGFEGPNYNFTWHNWLLISDNGEFYFPEDNFRKYSIIKHNQEGNQTLIFGRKYNIKEYSKEARDRFYLIYEKQIKKGDKKFPESPPVIRKIFQDNKNNIWVISGETYEDNMNPDYDNTIDIFNDKGEFLYSSKSKFISRYCIYHEGRIYRVLPINPDTYEQFIEVYKIKYMR